MNKKEKKFVISLESLQLASIFPFVKNPCGFDEIKTSKAYMLWEKSVTEPRSLTRDEKDWLFRQFCGNVHCSSPNVIHIGGWRIVFPSTRKFLVQSSDDWRSWKMYMAFDKTSIRNLLGGRGEIIEYPEKETK